MMGCRAQASARGNALKEIASVQTGTRVLAQSHVRRVFSRLTAFTVFGAIVSCFAYFGIRDLFNYHVPSGPLDLRSSRMTTGPVVGNKAPDWLLSLISPPPLPSSRYNTLVTASKSEPTRSCLIVAIPCSQCSTYDVRPQLSSLLLKRKLYVFLIDADDNDLVEAQSHFPTLHFIRQNGDSSPVLFTFGPALYGLDQNGVFDFVQYNPTPQGRFFDQFRRFE